MLQKTSFGLALLLLVGFNFALAEPKLDEVKVSIPNMVCMSCEMQIEEAVHQVAGVSAIQFDGEAQTATVRFNAAETNIDQILAACKGAGYPASVVEPTAF